MPTKKLNGTAPKESTSALERSFINLDPDDPEYVKEMQRPAAIKVRHLRGLFLEAYDNFRKTSTKWEGENECNKY